MSWFSSNSETKSSDNNQVVSINNVDGEPVIVHSREHEIQSIVLILIFVAMVLLLVVMFARVIGRHFKKKYTTTVRLQNHPLVRRLNLVIKI
jgi:hypothetical protein